MSCQQQHISNQANLIPLQTSCCKLPGNLLLQLMTKLKTENYQQFCHIDNNNCGTTIISQKNQHWRISNYIQQLSMHWWNYYCCCCIL